CFNFAWAPFLRSALTVSPSISLLLLAVCICCAFLIILHCSYVFTQLYPQAHQDSRLLSPQYVQFCLYSPICFHAPPCFLAATHSVVSALEKVA
ncbi:hypothetical protein C8J57DRAFT_1343843, partial [Mycena rebaudengoi]